MNLCQTMDTARNNDRIKKTKNKILNKKIERFQRSEKSARRLIIRKKPFSFLFIFFYAEIYRKYTLCVFENTDLHSGDELSQR